MHNLCLTLKKMTSDLAQLSVFCISRKWVCSFLSLTLQIGLCLLGPPVENKAQVPD